MRCRYRAWTVLTIASLSAFGGCAARTGDAAPAFELTDIDGNLHTLAQYRGQVVLLDFWATWCPPCVASSPNMQRLHERFEDEPFALLAVHFDDRGDPAAYARKHRYTFRSLTNGREVCRTYGVNRIPTLILVADDGTIVHRQTGFRDGDEDALAQLIQQELAN